MPVDLTALYLKLYEQCQRAPGGIYTCDTQRFEQDTGYTTFNVLSALMGNGSINVRAVGKVFPDDLYQITLCKMPTKEMLMNREESMRADSGRPPEAGNIEAQEQIIRDRERQAHALTAEEAATLKPTPEAIIRQIESTLEKIERTYRYAKYAGELIARGSGGREIALCITKLQEAKQWAKEALNERGEG